MPSPSNQRNPFGLRALALRWALLAALSLIFLSAASAVFAQTPLPAPSSAKSLFQDRPFGPVPPPTPTPPVKVTDPDDDKPIPAGWYIGGAATAALLIVGLLYGTARASRSSNLFDRQYHFPVGAEAALRLGATRCGGHMAMINFGPTERLAPSETKDA